MIRFALGLALISLPASAQWQAITASSQLSVESSKISVSLSYAERATAREKRKRDEEPEELVAECLSHADCDGYCLKGSCVAAIDEDAPRVEEPRPPALETPKVSRCSAETQCAEGLSCVSGYCLSPPPPPASLLRRAAELYVRHNSAQLRQDLALGDGPAINILARLHGVPVKDLAKVARAHRHNLVRALGDPQDVEWPSRFLEVLEKGLTLTPTLSRRERESLASR